MSLTRLSSNRSFGGWHERWSHPSSVLQCRMVFSIYLPPQVQAGRSVPVLYWLSGLTCTDENFMQKAGAQRLAADLGMILVAPDTSPRGSEVPGDPDGAWDFGLGASFYVNATQQPWAEHYRMHDYVVQELPKLIEANFPATPKRGISGHSMGGHGALVCALRNPETYHSVSAFAPISNPCACPWGEKAFSRYFGDDRRVWARWDASVLLPDVPLRDRLPILIDQGEQDGFLAEQLKPEALEEAAKACDYPLTVRRHSGYDHSYFFVASFIDDHLRHHAKALCSA